MTRISPEAACHKTTHARRAQAGRDSHLEAVEGLYDGSPCPTCGGTPAAGSLSCTTCLDAMTWRVARWVEDILWSRC